MLKCRLDFDPHEILGIIETPPVVLVGDPPHYGRDIAASDISPQQTAAHHSYYGARIELLKQGFLTGGSLHVYDIASAYPAAMVEFPSLASGEWIQKLGHDLSARSISELRATLEAASCVSMFKI